MTVLITGVSGFIGYHLASRLLSDGIEIIGIDNMNDYYDVKLKEDRLKQLILTSKKYSTNFEFIKLDIAESSLLNDIFNKHKPDKVINLAAQAGVRYSLIAPSNYIKSNLVGFFNILECSRNFNIKHLIYASSSSVYGGNKILPFSESQSTDHPVSLYAATKKSNELMAHSYSHLFSIPSTGLRFFTVYGPWGRPDMALFLFTQAILKNKSIQVFNEGNMKRDFTYIDDVVESIIRLIDKPPVNSVDFDFNSLDPSTSWAPHRIFNIGSSSPVNLMEYIKAIESSLGIQAKKKFLPLQPGDVAETEADTKALENFINYKPKTTVSEGIEKFVKWYLSYYPN